MLNAVKFLMRFQLNCLILPFFCGYWFVYIGCVVSWICPGNILSVIVGIVGNPIRPILPFGGIIPLGGSGWYLDLAPFPIGIALHLMVGFLGSIRDSRMLAHRSKPTPSTAS